MRKVFKYPCEPDSFVLHLPVGAQVLSIQNQDDETLANLWAMVDPSAKTEPRRFHIAGTGHELPDVIKAYIGTFQIAGGALVFHAFELKT